jgi:hypothetical protein
MPSNPDRPMTPMLRRALPFAFVLACGLAHAGGLTIEVHATPSVLPTPAGRALVYELSARNTVRTARASSTCAPRATVN